MTSPLEKSDEARFHELQKKQEKAWDAACNRCGACCGVTEGDPCENLGKDSEDKYFCRIYEHRFGLRRTVGGREFQCVPLRWIMHQTWPGDHLCSYKKKDFVLEGGLPPEPSGDPV